MVGPRACLEDNPTSQSVRLCGRWVNLSELARNEGLDHGYLSKIFAGERVASTTYNRRIARGLHMTMDDLLEALDDRKADLLEEARLRLA